MTAAPNSRVSASAEPLLSFSQLGRVSTTPAAMEVPLLSMRTILHLITTKVYTKTIVLWVTQNYSGKIPTTSNPLENRTLPVRLASSWTKSIPGTNYQSANATMAEIKATVLCPKLKLMLLPGNEARKSVLSLKVRKNCKLQIFDCQLPTKMVPKRKYLSHLLEISIRWPRQTEKTEWTVLVKIGLTVLLKCTSQRIWGTMNRTWRGWDQKPAAQPAVLSHMKRN